MLLINNNNNDKDMKLGGKRQIVKPFEESWREVVENKTKRSGVRKFQKLYYQKELTA